MKCAEARLCDTLAADRVARDLREEAVVLYRNAAKAYATAGYPIKAQDMKLQLAKQCEARVIELAAESGAWLVADRYVQAAAAYEEAGQLDKMHSLRRTAAEAYEAAAAEKEKRGDTGSAIQSYRDAATWYGKMGKARQAQAMMDAMIRLGKTVIAAMQ